MRKHSQLPLTLLFTLSLLAGCKSKMQGPTKPDTVLPPNSSINTPSYRPPATDFTPNSRGPSEPINAIGGSNDANGLTARDEDKLPKIDWDHPPAELIVATIYFDFNQFNVTRKDPVTGADDQALLDTVAKTLTADPTLHVVAVGHCDWYGSDQYNLVLSDKRSNTAKGYLAQLGAGATQTDILARGKYGAAPDVKKSSPQAMHDRRVDIVKIPAGAMLPMGTPPTAGAAPAAPAGPQ